jgi:hypothetical protein
MLIKSNWRNILPAAIAALVAPLVIAVQAGAADTATVAATVTPQNISVTVADGSVAYGTLAVSSNASTIASGLNDTQTATNNGNVAEDFNITSTDATGGNTWTLAGTIGADQYKHSYCNTGSGSPDPCDTGATWNAMSTGYTQIANSVSAAGTSKFDLKIDTPSTVSDYTQKSITVTVQAVAD